MIFCPNCGSENKEDAIFCMKCGSRLSFEEQKRQSTMYTTAQQDTQQMVNKKAVSNNNNNNNKNIILGIALLATGLILGAAFFSDSPAPTHESTDSDDPTYGSVNSYEFTDDSVAKYDSNPQSVVTPTPVDISSYFDWSFTTAEDSFLTYVPEGYSYVSVIININNDGDVPISTDPSCWAFTSEDGTTYSYDAISTSVASQSKVEPGESFTFYVHYVVEGVPTTAYLSYSNPYTDI